jgi:hydroxypyruvate reductase 1
VYCNYAVGFNNVDTVAATVYGIAVGNTPGVLTETTAEMAVALTFAAARRVIEGDRFVREGRFTGWLPTLFLGQLLNHKTLGVIGTGRIGEAYARMMVGGFCMNLVYYDLHENKSLENFVASFSMLQREMGNPGISVKRAETIDELLAASDVISLHTTLNESTYHLINAERLSLMKDSAILINVSRGNVVDEKMLVLHCSTHPEFRVGLDVYENEPVLSTGLSELPNVVLAPHLGSATMWTRTNMAMLSAHNIAAILNGYPVWNQQDISPFLADLAPKAAPSIVNAHELGLPLYLAH